MRGAGPTDDDVSSPYPWQERVWQDLASRLAGDRLGHAYLVCGRTGLGKRALAEAFADLVLCESPRQDQACGNCRSCNLIAGGSHPDLKIVQAEEDRKSIGIEQVRELIEFFALTTHYGRRKIVIIDPAEIMTTAAANALLKLLEEPPGLALLMLVSHRPGQLVATILSRCQKIKLAEPDWPTCLAWLDACREANPALPDARAQILAGAPLAILARLEAEEGPLHDRLLDTLDAIRAGDLDVLEAARRDAGADMRELADALELIVSALVEARNGLAPRFLYLPPAAVQRLQDLANHLHSGRLLHFLDRVGEARAMLLRSSGVRGGEVLENLMFHWSRMVRTETTA